MNLSCVIYIRVSDRQQVAGSSLADQEAACRAFAARMGYRVIRVYRDEGRSAYKDDLRHRPEFVKMLAAARSYRAVLVYQLDRFARRARIFHTCRWQLEQAGATLFSATEPNESSAAGRLSSAMLADFAEFYSARLSERIRGAALSKAQRGLWVGPPPFGYDLVNRQLVPGACAEWVPRIFEWFAEGYSAIDVAKELNAAGVPLRSGKPWTKDSVYMVLRNHAYIGWAGGRAIAAYEAAHQPLVSRELWGAVSTLLSERRRRPTGPRKSSRPAPLPWQALCDLCGGPMNRHPHGERPYLHCRASLNKTCSARGVRLDLVEHQVELLRKSGAPVAVVWLRAPRGIVRFE